tara:strand:+ start:496 stop:756 length:261 start_codon:yes stop_codon:yes gene_type:complete
MSHYDSKVSNELSCDFIDVKLQDSQVYRKYRHILLASYPNKEGMGWPTYLLVSNLENEFLTIGEIKGGMTKGEFRNKLELLINKDS